MPNLILINATKRTSSSKVENFSSAKQFALDINQIISPIRFSVGSAESYFTTRELAGMQPSSRSLAQISFRTSDTLTTLAAQSDGLVTLTVVTRRGVDMKSENMVFVTAKIKEALTIVATGTRFYYMEDGDPDGVEYIVSQTPAAIVTSGTSPVFNMHGRDLYVNDLQGNNATAEKGNQLLPWLTVTAALAAAVAGDTVVILEGAFTVANAYVAGVNIEVRTNATLTITAYSASGVGNQTIYGGGNITTTGANGFLMNTTFNGTIKVDVGTWLMSGASGGNNLSINGAVFDLTADYVTIDTTCSRVFKCLGNGTFNWRIKIKQTDNSTGNANNFLINATNANTSFKAFDIKIANGTSKASNGGFLLLNATDNTYVINLDCTLAYDGSAGSPCFNSIIAARNCITGTQVNLNGSYYLASGRQVISVNSLVRIHDRSICFSLNTNTSSVIVLAGGASIYDYYGGKKTYSTAESINIGTFAGVNNNADFGAITATGGTDILNFKGALKCAYLNILACGILVTAGATGLIIDGGTIEMVNGVSNKAINAASPENILVYGTGFTNGLISGNITNVVAGTNIISDPNVVANV